MSEYKIVFSDPHIIVPDDYCRSEITVVKGKRIGEILLAADLVSPAQINVALQDQQYHQLHLGEILAIRGWIKQETADFFARQWPEKIKTDGKLPLGYYFKEAALLNESQIEAILAEQKIHWLKFGAIAVLKGWVKQTTLDFFIANLFPEHRKDSIYFRKKITDDESKITQPTVIETNHYDEISSIIDDLNLNDDYRIIDDTISKPSRKNNFRFNSWY
jgi:hypothetical protein